MLSLCRTHGHHSPPFDECCVSRACKNPYGCPPFWFEFCLWWVKRLPWASHQDISPFKLYIGMNHGQTTQGSPKSRNMCLWCWQKKKKNLRSDNESMKPCYCFVLNEYHVDIKISYRHISCCYYYCGEWTKHFPIYFTMEQFQFEINYQVICCAFL